MRSVRGSVPTICRSVIVYAPLDSAMVMQQLREKNREDDGRRAERVDQLRPRTALGAGRDDLYPTRSAEVPR